MNIRGGCLVVAFTESSSKQEAQAFQREVFEESMRRETQGIIFDVSDVSLIDSFMSRNLVDICRAGLILGKETVVVGLKPAVVISLIDLEIDLSSIQAAVNIEEAVALIHRTIADSESFETPDATLDENVELEEEDDNEVGETEEDLAE